MRISGWRFPNLTPLARHKPRRSQTAAFQLVMFTCCRRFQAYRVEMSRPICRVSRADIWGRNIPHELSARGTPHYRSCSNTFDAQWQTHRVFQALICSIASLSVLATAESMPQRQVAYFLFSLTRLTLLFSISSLTHRRTRLHDGVVIRQPAQSNGLFSNSQSQVLCGLSYLGSSIKVRIIQGDTYFC